ncbi:3-oxoacyl-ACP reductase [Methylobacterium variabile]|jgi:NAD(P)-dependent dehydrogenase (short-subunit alcohol dehydrogenase family)|uniref:3-oxoacyl-ACP reductase n=1 Tax=Methylobacterium variabile TaxID=298794 RepID=A0A0J6SFQ5_9HYPH|nr:glucose 1-dehydrogenase [Methylobacterium variabile]KMO32203.1 3-oxoacyl-ACP reductase [Methylobacterium variabile]
MLLRGRVALVTGAGQGNGAAIARGLAKEGATLVCTDIDPAAADRTARAIAEDGGQATAYALDVADKAAAERLAAALDAAQPVSIIVNNAGICPRHRIDSPDLAQNWQAAIDVNLTGALNVTVAFLPALRRTKGTVVNIASIASFVSTATSVSYPVSKAGLRALTQSLAHELAPEGIRVNAIAPGTIATPMTEATRLDPARSERFLARIPMGRYGEPEELVGPVVFLASSMSSYVTGTTLVVDGGYLAL